MCEHESTSSQPCQSFIHGRADVILHYHLRYTMQRQGHPRQSTTSCSRQIHHSASGCRLHLRLQTAARSQTCHWDADQLTPLAGGRPACCLRVKHDRTMRMGCPADPIVGSVCTLRWERSMRCAIFRPSQRPRSWASGAQAAAERVTRPARRRCSAGGRGVACAGQGAALGPAAREPVQLGGAPPPAEARGCHPLLPPSGRCWHTPPLLVFQLEGSTWSRASLAPASA